MSCTIASSPERAVTSGGSVRVSAGSSSATRGSSDSCRMLALTPLAASASTVLRVASEPVPAVVGASRSGAAGRVTGTPRPTTSR